MREIDRNRAAKSFHPQKGAIAQRIAPRAGRTPAANPPSRSFPSINLESLKIRHDSTAVLLYGNGRVG